MSEKWLQDFADNLAAAADACPDQMDELAISQAELAATSATADVAQEAFEEAHVGVFGSASPHAEWYDHLFDALPIPSLSTAEAGLIFAGGCIAGPGGCALGGLGGGVLFIKAKKDAFDALNDTQAALNVANLELKAAQLKNAIALRKAMECVWHNLMKAP